MAHAALIENNIVKNIIVVPDEALDENESDKSLQEYLHSHGILGSWIRYSINGNIRGCAPAIGYVYDSENDIFKEPEIEQGKDDYLNEENI
jgi:hypothetical protein